MRSVCLILGLLVITPEPAYPAAVDEVADRNDAVNNPTPPAQAEAKLTRMDKDSVTVTTKDGSQHRIPVSHIFAYRQRNGNIEMKLANGRVLVVSSGKRESNNTDWHVVQRNQIVGPPSERPVRSTPNPKIQAEATRMYRSIAADLQHLIDAARPAIETTFDAKDVRTVAFGLRDLHKAIKAERWNGAVARVTQMRAALERVRKIAREAPKRLAQREQKSAEREKNMERLRIEIDMLAYGSEVGPALSGDVRELTDQLALHARRLRQLQEKRKQLQRELKKLVDEERREKDHYERLTRQSKI